MRSLKSLAPGILGLAVSAFLLVLVFYSIQWPEFVANLSNVRWRFLPVLIILLLLALWIRALRWKHLLPTGLDLSHFRLLEAITVGFFASMVLPLRAGEFVRPWFLSRFQPVSFSMGFASIVVERVFDVLALMLLLGFCLAQIEQAPPLVLAGAKALSALALCIGVGMIVSYFYSEGILRLINRLNQRVLCIRHPHVASTIERMAGEFLTGLRAISSFKELLLVVFWSLVLWLEFAFLYQVALWTFSEFPSLWVGQTLNVMIALAVAAPSAPGFVGTFEAGCVVALTNIYHYPREFALAYAVFIHSFQVLLICLFGALILAYRGLRFRDIRSRTTNTP